MQAQKLNTALTAQQTKAASTWLTTPCKLKKVPAKAPVNVNADHKATTNTQKGKSGDFNFAGIAG